MLGKDHMEHRLRGLVVDPNGSRDPVWESVYGKGKVRA